MILIVRDPIGMKNISMIVLVYILEFYSVRLVSDIVHYNTTNQKSRRRVFDIDKLIMGEDSDDDRPPYYAHLNISMEIFFTIQSWGTKCLGRGLDNK